MGKEGWCTATPKSKAATLTAKSLWGSGNQDKCRLDSLLSSAKAFLALGFHLNDLENEMRKVDCETNWLQFLIKDLSATVYTPFQDSFNFPWVSHHLPTLRNVAQKRRGICFCFLSHRACFPIDALILSLHFLYVVWDLWRKLENCKNRQIQSCSEKPSAYHRLKPGELLVQWLT